MTLLSVCDDALGVIASFLSPAERGTTLLRVLPHARFLREHAMRELHSQLLQYVNTELCSDESNWERRERSDTDRLPRSLLPPIVRQLESLPTDFLNAYNEASTYEEWIACLRHCIDTADRDYRIADFSLDAIAVNMISLNHPCCHPHCMGRYTDYQVQSAFYCKASHEPMSMRDMRAYFDRVDASIPERIRAARWSMATNQFDEYIRDLRAHYEWEKERTRTELTGLEHLAELANPPPPPPPLVQQPPSLQTVDGYGGRIFVTFTYPNGMFLDRSIEEYIPRMLLVPRPAAPAWRDRPAASSFETWIRQLYRDIRWEGGDWAQCFKNRQYPLSPLRQISPLRLAGPTVAFRWRRYQQLLAHTLLEVEAEYRYYTGAPSRPTHTQEQLWACFFGGVPTLPPPPSLSLPPPLPLPCIAREKKVRQTQRRGKQSRR